jgi:hypothetical protein
MAGSCLAAADRQQAAHGLLLDPFPGAMQTMPKASVLAAIVEPPVPMIWLRRTAEGRVSEAANRHRPKRPARPGHPAMARPSDADA